MSVVLWFIGLWLGAFVMLVIGGILGIAVAQHHMGVTKSKRLLRELEEQAEERAKMPPHPRPSKEHPPKVSPAPPKPQRWRFQ